MARAQSQIEQVIRARVAQHPDETWLKWQDTEFAWHEVLSNIQRAANGLIDLGIRPGERVAILMRNRPEFLWTHFGIVFMGALSVPVNISQRGPTLEHILTDSDAVAIVLEDDLRDHVLAVKDNCPELRRTVVVDGKEGGGIDRAFETLMDAPDTEPDIEVEQPSTGVGMMYTSGTTGPPKGVVSRPAPQGDAQPSRPNAFMQVLQAIGVKPGETMYTGLPLFHGNALYASTMGSIFLDAKLALAPKFTASGLWDDCRRHGAVEFNTLGGMISILLKQPPRPDDRDNPVRTVLSAACPPDRWQQFEERFDVKIVEWYGMVDAPGLMLNPDGRVGAMGKPIGGIDFRVVDDDDAPLPAGEVGQLVFKLPYQATHYHKRPDATEEAWKGGWFHTGDLASYDDDGYFYFKGRRKESIRRLGENISAWEIETVVDQHPKILESAAFAVRSELGEDEVALAVVPKPGQTPTPEEIVEFCAGKMAHYAVPRYVELLDELPKTPTHRIQHSRLKERGITDAMWDREKSGWVLERK